jgi:hypothetical protein
MLEFRYDYKNSSIILLFLYSFINYIFYHVHILWSLPPSPPRKIGLLRKHRCPFVETTLREQINIGMREHNLIELFFIYSYSVSLCSNSARRSITRPLIKPSILNQDVIITLSSPRKKPYFYPKILKLKRSWDWEVRD